MRITHFLWRYVNASMHRVEDERRRTVGLWIKRATLEEQVYLEKTLEDAIKSARFECRTHNFDAIISRQISEKTDRRPLVDQFLSLLSEERELQQRVSELDKRNSPVNGVETVASVTSEIEQLRKENESLTAETEELSIQIATFDDPEIHLLLAELQHLQLQRMKSNGAE